MDRLSVRIPFTFELNGESLRCCLYYAANHFVCYVNGLGQFTTVHSGNRGIVIRGVNTNHPDPKLGVKRLFQVLL